MDGVRLVTKGRTHNSYVNRLIPWKRGSIYDPEAIAELEKRLRETGVYDSVAVSLAPGAEAYQDGQRPVVVTLTDKPRSTLEPTASFGDGPIDYVKAQAQISAYWAFDAKGDTDLAGRIHVGDILAGNIPGIPASRRFYAGGGGSVRGYGYQDVGPRFPNDTPEGGITLLEGTMELRQQVYGPWAVAAFVDSGVLGQHETFDLSTVETGVGFGVRYNLGFAPFRFDIAFPIEKRSDDAAFQVYISIGQAF